MFPSFTGCVLSSQVSQTPPNLIKKANQNDVKINCQHKIQGYYVVLWYRQKEGTEMTLMGFLNGDQATYEKQFENTVVLYGDASPNQNNSITIRSLSEQDTAVYYCAASLHGTTICLSVWQKPSPC